MSLPVPFSSTRCTACVAATLARPRPGPAPGYSCVNDADSTTPACTSACLNESSAFVPIPESMLSASAAARREKPAEIGSPITHVFVFQFAAAVVWNPSTHRRGLPGTCSGSLSSSLDPPADATCDTSGAIWSGSSLVTPRPTSATEPWPYEFFPVKPLGRIGRLNSLYSAVGSPSDRTTAFD